MEQSLKNKSRLKAVFWIAAVSSWLSLLLSPLIVFGLLLWVGALVYLFISKTKLKWYLLFVSTWTLVPLWSFMSGSKDYFQGKAALETFGMPDAEFYNLDPELRVWNSTSGCMVMGTEMLTQTPNNLAVRLWTSLLGTQKGVYKGVYPTKQEAQDLVKRGKPVKLTKQGDAFMLTYERQPLSLRSQDYDDLDVLEKTTDAKAVVLNNECLLMETMADTTQRTILLADKSNGRIFARYYDRQSR